MIRKRKPQQGIQSIEVGATLLSALSRAHRPQMLRDLAQQTGMPAAKAHRYLVSLSRMGLVEQHSETGLYDLGPFALQLGLSALARLDVVKVAAASLPELSREIDQTVALAVWANQGATIVRWIGADSPVAASLRVGSVMPLTRSATGGAFLAFLPSAATKAMVTRELSENRRKGLMPCTREAVEALSARARTQGFVYTSEFIPGIAGIAAPVFDHSHGIVMALVALGYSKPFDAQIRNISTTVLRAAEVLSRRLGARASEAPTGRLG